MRRTLLPRFAVAAAFVVAACGDGNGPGGGEFDPGTSQQEAEAVLATVGDNPAIRSLSLIDPAQMDFAATGLLEATLPSVPTGITNARPWALRRYGMAERLRPSLSRTGTDLVIPTDVRGTTYVYNTSSGDYEESSQSGAPSNGVRFILYEVNDAGTAPVMPLNDVGHLDLLDESSGSTNALGIVGVIDGETLLDYTASASATQSSFGFGAEGYITDGTTRLDFVLENEFSESELHILYQMDVAGEDTGFRFEITADATGGAEIEIEVSAGGDTLLFHAEGELEGDENFVVSGTVSFNGDVVAEFTTDGDDVEFTDADGNPLSQEDLAALEELFEFGALFEVFDALLAPAVSIVEIGF
jgi:hypothetical protein